MVCLNLLISANQLLSPLRKMGASLTKSPLERRNTVLRRSQRKSINTLQPKVKKLHHDIQKFSGTEQDPSYHQLQARLHQLRREIALKEKDLQPQVRNFHQQVSESIQQCQELLASKIEPIPQTIYEEEDEEKTEEQEVQELETTDNKRKTVELTVVQIEASPSSPEYNKRMSVIKQGGVAVLPLSIMASTLRKQHEKTLNKVRKNVEGLEMEISQFVGRKNGRHYIRIKNQLVECLETLKGISEYDDELIGDVGRCEMYVQSCFTFLDEKASDLAEDSDDDDVFETNNNQVMSNTLNSKSFKTTFI